MKGLKLKLKPPDSRGILSGKILQIIFYYPLSKKVVTGVGKSSDDVQYSATVRENGFYCL
jgi:hypothetical protein